MKQFLFTMLLICLIKPPVRSQTPGRPLADPRAATKTTMALLHYLQDHVRLWEDFTGYNRRGQKITKLFFLKAITTGKYLPLQLASVPRNRAYKLYPFTGYEGSEVADIVAQMARYELAHYQQEGKKFPPFRFKDLKGNVYTNANTRGKILVLKSWFIKCMACNEEMPKLNEVVDKYKNRKDIVFVSIAFDSKADLLRFAQHRQFNYAIASVNENYIEKNLKTNIYPTHWVISKTGLIIKRTNEPDVMIETLDRLGQQ